MKRQLLLLAIVGLSLSAPADKVDRHLRSTLATQGKANIVVSFKEDTQPILNRINSLRFSSRSAKITAMKAQLEDLQATSQKNVLQLLSTSTFSNLQFHSLWVNNRLYIENANQEVISAIASFPEVTEVREQLVLHIPQPTLSSNVTIQAEWGIDKIEAGNAWALPGGNNGAGVVVAAVDTGARSTHEALRGNFRADYGWFDPYLGVQNPADNVGHGTHVLGTIAGSGGIGVAPGAQWIACRGCSAFGCTEAALTRCGQWVICPTLYNGASPDCSKAGQVSSNSWGGGQGSNFYDSVINAYLAAGVVPVFANGNDGENGCGTANSPGDSTGVIGVGATDSSDTIAYFSSLGPAVRGHIKPDVSAPGQDVRSAYNSGDAAYQSMSGTSMATPHVAGAVALLLSRNPQLTVDQVKNYLQDEADRSLGSAPTCGGTPPTEFPNNVYGHGRINVRKSLEAVIRGV